ncbi:ROK family protein [Streptococcus tangpeifui]|uniref:ROK family protein n=1 Tax=Streptococcus tangpeifui TaxID=2709400 RepID=UPI0013ED7534|nr:MULTISPECIES: ROK family protein [unclassified Streptococcus]
MGTVTEREKMLAGRLYDASDPELVDLRQQARVITRMFNAEEDEEQAQALLKTFFGKTGQNITVNPRFVCDYGSNIYVGENFYANYNCTFLDVCEIRIGDNVMFGPNCQLLTALHPLEAEERIKGKEFGSPITIGDNVWCGGGSTILPGVTLGDNVVVGAGSVVTKSFGDNVVIAGNPAQVIKDLTETSCLAIDIGGSAIKHALIDEQLTLTQEGQVPTPASLEEFWTSLTAIVEQYQDEIKAIAISCPGEISKNGRVYRGGLIPYLKNVPLAKHLSEQFSMPVTVLNDANAAALAETKSGVLKDSSCGAILVLGTGVGLGVVSENHLVTFPSRDLRPSAQDFRSNDESVWRQISHTLELNRIGIESLFSNAGSAVKFVEDASRLLGLKEADGKQVFQALEEEPSGALQELFETYCRDIAYLVLNLQTFLKVENLAIGGGISRQPLLVKTINEQYDKLFTSVLAFQHFEQLEIEAAVNGNDANLIGAYLHLMANRK